MKRIIGSKAPAGIALLATLGFVACSSDGDPPAADARSVDGRVRADASADARVGTDGGAGCPRWVLEGQARNTRDIGDWPLAEGKRTQCRRIYRGGDLAALDQTGCAEFAALDITTVIDLREESEQVITPNAACVSDTTPEVTAALPKLVPDSPENYVALLDYPDAWKTLFQTLAVPANYPVYIHCIIGRDRAALAATLILLIAGASEDTVRQEFALSAQAFVPVPVKIESFDAFITELNRRGGAEDFLLSAGVTSPELDAVRNLITNPDL